MFQRLLVVGAVTASFLVLGCTGAPLPAPKAQILPLRTLHLYETGVGYFERSGDVGTGATTLPVPTGHLDDALKTLVIIGPGGKIRGFEFGSSVSKGMARAQAGLDPNADAPITFRGLLTSLKGARVEMVVTSAALTGRIIDVVDEVSEEPASTDPKAEKKPPVLVVMIVTDKGEIRRVPAAQIVTVRPTDPAYGARLNSSLDALSTRSAATPRALELLGAGNGPVTFGYVAETPIWRASYRLVLDPDQKGGLLQGWALLHNDTDEMWKGVKVSLVNGRPDSFLFPMAAPRYARRTLVTPDGTASTVPQLLDKTPDAIWGDNLDETGTVGHGAGTGSGVGYGSGYGKIGSSHSYGFGGLGMVSEGSSSLLSVGNLAGVATATGLESGALFAYSLDGSLDLGAHKSALVPFLAQRPDVEAITWIDDTPRAAVRFANSTSQTLPSGTLSFFSSAGTTGGGGGFIGESALDRLKPGERRFVDFGADLAVDLTKISRKFDEDPKTLRFLGDSLEENFLRTVDSTWDVENRSGLPRKVYVVLHLDKNASIKGADGQDFDTAAHRPLAWFAVKAKSKLSRDVTTVEGLKRMVPFTLVNTVLLTRLSNAKSLPSAQHDVIVDALARQKELDEAKTALAKNKEEIGVVEGDLTRFREHLKAMGDKAAGPGTNPFVQKILQAEDKLTALRKARAALEKDEVAKKDAVRTSLKKLPS